MKSDVVVLGGLFLVLLYLQHPSCSEQQSLLSSKGLLSSSSGIFSFGILLLTGKEEEKERKEMKNQGKKDKASFFVKSDKKNDPLNLGKCIHKLENQITPLSRIHVRDRVHLYILSIWFPSFFCKTLDLLEG